MNALRISCFAFILLCFPARSRAGDTATRRGLSISSTPTQLLVLDIPLQLELRRGRKAFGLNAAYRHRSNGNYEFTGLLDIAGIESMQADFLSSDRRAITLGANFKYYFSPSGSWYGDVHFFYRRWWRERKEDYIFPYYPQFNPDAFYSNVYGTKFLIGYTALLSRKGKVRPILNAWAGAGLRLRYNYNSTIVFLSPGAAKQIREYRDHSVIPSFQLGFNIGIFVVSKPRAATDK